MSTFEEKVKAQSELQKSIFTLYSNFKKEPKRNVKLPSRLKQWRDRLSGLWEKFKTAHAEISKCEREFLASEYFVNRESEKMQ